MEKKRFWLCLNTLLVIFITGCSNKSNVIPPKPLEVFIPKLNVSYLWSKNIGNGNGEQMDITLSPSVYDRNIYTTSFNGYISAVNSDNGSILWSRNSKLKLTSSPLVSEEFVIVGSLYGELIALSRNNGNIVWQANLPSSLFSKPALYNNIIYTQTHDGSVTVYALKTGKMLWTQKVPAPDLMLIGNSSPIVYKDLVLVGNSSGSLWGFKLDDGQKQWDNPVALPNNGSPAAQMFDITATPIIDNETLYIATFQGNLVSFDTASGEINWQVKASIFNNLGSNYDQLFASTATGQIIAYSKKIGTISWKQDMLEGREPSAPLYTDGYVIVGDYEGYVHIFSAQTGQYLDRVKIGGNGVRSQPIAIGKKIFVQTNNGKLAALAL